jgi:hypothetical protein
MSSPTVVCLVKPSAIVNYELSPLSHFRFRLFFANGKRIDIGTRDGAYYTDHGIELHRRDYYRALNCNEWDKLYARTPCRFVFESIILNGKYPTIVENINLYNDGLIL